MKVKKFLIDGLLEIQPDIYKDERGYFFETYSDEKVGELIYEADPNHVPFVQDNESCSRICTLRGMHMQCGIYAQAKLVRVIKGMVLDVVVDLRVGSPTYGKHERVLLTDESHNMLYIPRGFAHGFCALKDDTIFSYKVDNVYNKESEICIRYNDPKLGIIWPYYDDYLIVSQKDMQGISLEEYEKIMNI